MENMTKSLVEAIPQTLMREQTDRKDLLSTLKKRRDGYEKAVQDKAQEIEKAEKDLSQAVSSGQDGGKVLARIETLKRESEGTKRLMSMTDDEIYRVEDLLVETRRKISEELSRVVLEKRLIIAAELETKIMDIEDDLNTWRTATVEAADAVGCDLRAGTDVFLKSRILRDHLM